MLAAAWLQPGWKAVFGGLLALSAGLGSLAGLGRLDYALTDMLRLAGGRAPSEDVVILAIDDKSIAELGRWPWRREVHARLLDQLAVAAPRAVGFDVIFDEADTAHPQDDRLLAQAIARAGNVVLPVVMQFVAGQPPQPWLPMAALGAAARDLGHVHLELDSDGVARSVFLREGMGQQAWDHFALALLRVGGGAVPAPLPGLRAPARNEAAGGLDATAWRRDHWVMVPFADPEHGYPQYSYVDVLHGRVPAAALKGKYVLIGAVSPGLGDAFPTPISGHGTLTPGVLVSAHLLDALMQGRSLVRATPWQNALFCALPVVLAMFALARLGTRLGLPAVAALFALMVAATALASRYAGVQFHPAAGLLSLLLAYPLWSWRRLGAVLAYLSEEAERLRAAHGDRRSRLRLEPRDDVDRHIGSLHHAIGQLQSLQRLISDSLDSLPDATFIVDVEGRIHRSNDIARRSLGEDPSDVLEGRSLHEVLAGFLAPESSAWLPDLARVSVPETFAREFTSRAGIDYLLKCVPRLSAFGGVVGWIVSLIDVHVVRDALRQRDEAMRFISHDMRAPQASILSLIELRRQGADVGDINAVLQRIEGFSRRTLGIAEDFIQLARVESGTCDAQLEDLESLLVEAVDTVWAKARARGIRIDIVPPQEPAMALVDDSLMSRALMNLLDNAIKFSPDGAVVHCGIDDAGDDWCFWIRDQGPGIPEDEQGQLFARFWRSRGARSSGVQGVGLGLTFVKRVVDTHGGKVGMRNVEPHGAEFTLAITKADLQMSDDEEGDDSTFEVQATQAS